MEDKSMILRELGAIKAGIIAIREELEDRNLSGEDLIVIEDYRKEKKKNALISHEEIKRELNENVRD